MSLNISHARVKDKCMLTGVEYDTTLAALISEMVPVLEFAIAPEWIAATSDTGLQATLNLGATEIVAGELLAQIARTAGWFDALHIGDVHVVPPSRSDPLDGYGLKAQGWARLRPYLRVDPAIPAPGFVMAAPGKQGGGS